jgi:hypothetical protein
MCDVKDENEVMMQGASILSPALLRSVCDRIGNAACTTRRVPSL